MEFLSVSSKEICISYKIFWLGAIKNWAHFWKIFFLIWLRSKVLLLKVAIWYSDKKIVLRKILLFITWNQNTIFGDSKSKVRTRYWKICGEGSFLWRYLLNFTFPYYKIPQLTIRYFIFILNQTSKENNPSWKIHC